MRLAKATRDAIARDLQTELDRSEGLTARQLARRIGRNNPSIDKSTVNSVLYARPSRFFADTSTPPVWATVPWAGVSSQALPGVDALNAVSWKSIVELDLPLSRLNLLYGANSAGKTSILQILLILSQSRGVPDLVLDGPAASCGSIENAVHSQDVNAAMSLGFRRGGIEIHKSYSGLNEILGDKSALVTKVDDSTWWCMPLPDGDFASRSLPDLRRWGVEPEAGAPDPESTVPIGTLYMIKEREGWPDSVTGKLAIQEGQRTDAPLPHQTVTAFRDWSREVREVHDSTLDSVVHLGPIRPMPDRWILRDLPRYESHDARLVVQLSEDPELVEDVNEWFEKLEIPYTVEILERVNADGAVEVALGLRRTTDSGELVALQDLGYGISQVLPIVVTALGSHGRIILIEQPEVHLHPRLQAALADLFITSSNDYKNQLLIETHSEHLLLRLQRRIAEGLLQSDDLAVSFVQREGLAAEVIPMEFASSGQMLEGWPDGFFDDRVQDLLAILDPSPS